MSSLIKENITQSWKRVITFTHFNKVIAIAKRVCLASSAVCVSSFHHSVRPRFEPECKRHHRNTLRNSHGLHISSSIERLFVPELFKMRRSKTGYLFELRGKVCYTAVMEESILNQAAPDPPLEWRLVSVRRTSSAFEMRLGYTKQFLH